MANISYKTSGVDIGKAEEFVKGIKLASAGRVEAFGAVFNLLPHLKSYKKPLLVSSTDGVGTKLIIAQKLGIHNTVGIDLVGMNVNDVICQGARPLFFLDYIACGKLEPKMLNQVMTGLNKGLKESDCALIGGETAEMPGMYDPDEYDLAGFCVGIVDQQKVIDGKNIKEGDLIIGITSSGFHSNGYSLVRKALSQQQIKEQAVKLLAPTRLYVRPIMKLLDSKIVRGVKAISHVTGGAFYTKVTKVLPKGYAMAIDKKSWSVPEIFRLVQQSGNISEKEMFSVFNMGIGMMVVVDKKIVKSALAILNHFFPTMVIGKIIKSQEKMQLK